ncbi:MAG TPA: hypothetical protein VMW48_09480 [Vicinamibacterales bacterium]|nr:hypothetical protein [Vicinamibacterales bacterium]
MSSSLAIGHRGRTWSYVIGGVGAIAACVGSVVAMGAWLVVADPAVAADVAAQRDLWPIVRAIGETMSDAFRTLLGLL